MPRFQHGAAVRDHIQQRVFRRSGPALNEFDLSPPPGEPGFYGPDSVIRARIHIIARLLRWVIHRGALQRAMTRVGR
ncbi:hypothetical protein [Erwinia pyrifoliae]|uniref:hypothetical protein n=1 Tax=Erwinia pyrifoliae TaxID=79967 RepID=UPI0001960F62|nr:hypothetical protein [Erwinia pyrifoliae]MCA8877579.1 hypothetical protein [Erwinia pyrifoliae]MCT2388431.1 hypothetical protein [Erwinia pyrifoliae]MCU8586600.1 hypothetical protein [Erwinia pyrifoliae]UXK13498.1 hypothetical protein NYP80_06700 [Erwinia pyrifoliae]CAX56152.1 uncharacterized protein EpC_23730 [Erwinia pyrifoliae Ep1/96]